MSSELGVERPTSLALADPPPERRVHFTEAPSRPHNPTTPSPRKPRPDPDFRPKRKRSLSFSGAGGDYRGNKRRKRGRVLPSKFLLGGSITDPLNLGSLDDEEDVPPADGGDGGGGNSGSNSNKKWAAVRVIIPPNINDPLNLDASSDNEDLFTDALSKSLRRRRRSRKRKRRLSEPSESTAGVDATNTVQEAETSGQRAPPAPLTRQNSLKPLTVNTELTTSQGGSVEGRRESVGPVTPTGSKPPGGGGGSGMARVGVFKKQRSKSDNKIVSPVIPQPGGERKRHPSHSRHHADRPHLSQQNLRPPASFNPKNEVFQYGNYNKYYGYRNPSATPDPRLQYLRREWCEGREVLDVGCNIGHIALTIARDYSPKRVVGIDIDKKLINIAGKNIKHYMRTGDPEEATFPSSMRLLYGPLNTPVRADGTRSFPYNIQFIHANYVLESDELLETVRPEFDLILCLSITKWIHLNWGDSGLKRFLRRCFLNLRPGGRLLLEPQAWPSYNKRRKLTKRIFDNYKGIRLFPDKFNDFLLHEVGFSTSEKLGTPHHTARGFQRPIIVYTKAGCSSKCSPAGESGGREVCGSSKMVEKKKQEEKEVKKNAKSDLITQSVGTSSHPTLIPPPSSHTHAAEEQISKQETTEGGQIARKKTAEEGQKLRESTAEEGQKLKENTTEGQRASKSAEGQILRENTIEGQIKRKKTTVRGQKFRRHTTEGLIVRENTTEGNQISRENTTERGGQNVRENTTEGSQISREITIQEDQMSRQDTLVIQDSDRGRMGDNNFKEKCHNLYQFNQETLVQEVKSEKCKNSGSSSENVCDNKVGDSKHTTLIHSTDEENKNPTSTNVENVRKGSGNTDMHKGSGSTDETGSRKTDKHKDSPVSAVEDRLSVGSSEVTLERCVRVCGGCDEASITSSAMPDQQGHGTGRDSVSCRCTDVTGTSGETCEKIKIKCSKSEKHKYLPDTKVSTQSLDSVETITKSEINPEGEENKIPQSEINPERKENAIPRSEVNPKDFISSSAESTITDSEINPEFCKSSVTENVEDRKNVSKENVEVRKVSSIENVEVRKTHTENVEFRKTISAKIVGEDDSSMSSAEKDVDAKIKSAKSVEDVKMPNAESTMMKCGANPKDVQISNVEKAGSSKATDTGNVQESTTTHCPRKRQLSASDAEDGKLQDDDSSKKPRLEDT